MPNIDLNTFKDHFKLHLILDGYLRSLPDDDTRIKELLLVRDGNESIWSRILTSKDSISVEVDFFNVIRSLRTGKARVALLSSFPYSEAVRQINPSYDHTSLHYIIRTNKQNGTGLLSTINECPIFDSGIVDFLQILDKSEEHFGNTILHTAGYPDNCDAFERMLGFMRSCLLDPQTSLSILKSRNKHGNLAFVCNLRPSELRLIQELCSKDAVKSLLQEKNKSGETVLHFSACNSKNSRKILSLYSEEEARGLVEQTDNDGNTVLHCVDNSAASLQLFLNLYSNKERGEVLNKVNNQGENVFVTLRKYPSSFLVALDYYPQDKMLGLLFDCNDLGEFQYVGPPVISQIIPKLDPQDVVIFEKRIAEEIDRKKERETKVEAFLELRWPEAHESNLKQKIEELYRYGIKLQSSPNAERKKAGESATRLSENLMQYHTFVNDKNYDNYQNFRAALGKGYQDMSAYRNLGIIHSILRAIAKLVGYDFGDAKKEAKIGENSHGYFAKTSRQTLVEEIANASKFLKN